MSDKENVPSEKYMFCKLNNYLSILSMIGKSECEKWIFYMLIYKTWKNNTENKHLMLENYTMLYSLPRTEEQKADWKWTNHKKLIAYFSK